MSSPQQPTLWANLVSFMTEKGLSPNELADFMGWSNAEQYGRWERGDRKISLPTTRRLASFLDVDVVTLDPSGESFDPETRPSKGRRRGPKGPAQQPDTTDGQPARESKSAEENRVPDDPHLKKVQTLYEYFVHQYGDQASREELFQKLSAAMEELLADKRKQRGKVKNL